MARYHPTFPEPRHRCGKEGTSLTARFPRFLKGLQAFSHAIFQQFKLFSGSERFEPQPFRPPA